MINGSMTALFLSNTNKHTGTTQVLHTLAVGIPVKWPLAVERAKVEHSLPERLTWLLQMWPLELSGTLKSMATDLLAALFALAIKQKDFLHSIGQGSL